MTTNNETHFQFTKNSANFKLAVANKFTRSSNFVTKSVISEINCNRFCCVVFSVSRLINHVAVYTRRSKCCSARRVRVLDLTFVIRLNTRPSQRYALPNNALASTKHVLYQVTLFVITRGGAVKRWRMCAAQSGTGSGLCHSPSVSLHSWSIVTRVSHGGWTRGPLAAAVAHRHGLTPLQELQ